METIQNSTSFWEMGGYAAYVWGAYGAALAVLLCMLTTTWRYARRAQRRLKP